MSIVLDPSGKISITGATGEMLTILNNLIVDTINTLNSVITDSLVVAGVTVGTSSVNAVHSPALITAWSTSTKPNMDTEQAKLSGLKI